MTLTCIVRPFARTVYEARHRDRSLREVATGLVDDLQTFKRSVVGKNFIESVSNAIKVGWRFGDVAVGVERTGETTADIQEVHVETHLFRFVEDFPRKLNGVAVGVRIARGRTDVKRNAGDVQVEQRGDRKKL